MAGLFANRHLRSATVVACVLAIWEIAGRIAAARGMLVVPPPTHLVGFLGQNADTLFASIQPTLIEAVAGFAIGAVISLALAAIFVRFAAVEAMLSNAVLIIHSLPMLAIMPLLVIWFGIGYTPKITIAALAAFFPILNGAVRGLRSTDAGMMDLMHILDASWSQTLLKARIPASLPHIFAGLKIAAPQAVLGAAVAEWIGSRSGLGSQILIALLNYDIGLLWSCMVTCALLATAGFLLIELAEHVVVGRRSQPQREDA